MQIGRAVTYRYGPFQKNPKKLKKLSINTGQTQKYVLI